MASSYQRHKNVVELFLSTELCNLIYIGPSKIDIKMLSEMFIAEPYDREADAIEISVYSSFVIHKNILCHFSFDESHNVVMVFPTVDACKTVYDILMKFKGDVKQEFDGHSSNQQIRDLFFIPLLKEAKSNPTFNEQAKNCVINLMEDIATLVGAEEIPEDCNVKSELDEGLHQMLTESSKESSGEPMVVDDMNFTHPLDEYGLDVAVKQEVDLSFNAEANAVLDIEINERLETSENPECSRKRHESLETCQNPVEVKQCNIDVADEQEEDPAPVQPEASGTTVILQAKKVIKSTHFFIRNIKTTTHSHGRHELIVFLSDEKNLCYVYAFKKNNARSRFLCVTCLKRRHFALALLRCDDQSGEYFVELSLIKHICTPQIFNHKPKSFIEPCTSYASLFFGTPSVNKRKKKCVDDVPAEKCIDTVTAELPKDPSPTVDQVSSSNSPEPSTSKTPTNETTAVTSNKILKYPDFELQTVKHFGGHSRFRLITFATTDHKYCYVFFQNHPDMSFTCRRCQNFQPNITAFVHDGDDGEKYVSLNEYKHQCVPELYAEFCLQLKKDEYEIVYTREGNIQPIMYASADKKLCYVFTAQNAIMHNTYYCSGCMDPKIVAKLNVKKELNGEYTVKWKYSFHSCEPTVYVNEVEEKVLFSGKFKFFIEKNNPNDFKLMTFPFDDENDKCHIYKYSKIFKVFYCIKCLELDEFVIADWFMNAKKDEYILESNPGKHVCTPLLYSSLDSNNIFIQTSSRLEIKKFIEKIWIEKSQIIAENFEFQRNNNGTLNGFLIIFTSKERKTCYKYSYDISSLQYSCTYCKVWAKVMDENGKFFVKLSSTQHRCFPVIYQPERKIIRKPDFIFHSVKPFRLIVFTSPSHEYCYVYTAKTTCNSCRPFNVCATIFTDENGEECVYLGRREHICQPKKFENVAKKYGIEL